jgi:cold shock CspA family protein
MFVQSLLECVSYKAPIKSRCRLMKDTMTDSSPSAETIRFVIEILSARVTPLTELSQTIANIAQAVARLERPSSRQVVRPVPTVLPRREARQQPRRPVIAAWQPVAATRPAPAESLFRASPTVIPTIIPARRRGRPRKIAPAQPIAEVPVPEVAPPQPRLLRRAEALAHDADHHVESQPTFRAPNSPLRGVVKWFDGRAGKGALRLMGISGDVLLDPTVLTNSGIKRLYKDQEIEATVEETSGRIRLLSLSLPARNGEPTLNMMPGEITGTLRRQPRSVQVEIKRDGVRQTAARAEAEHVFGGVGRIKITRRPIP